MPRTLGEVELWLAEHRDDSWLPERAISVRTDADGTRTWRSGARTLSENESVLVWFDGSWGGSDCAAMAESVCGSRWSRSRAASKPCYPSRHRRACG